MANSSRNDGFLQTVAKSLLRESKSFKQSEKGFGQQDPFFTFPALQFSFEP
jgi:hypothetical protein